jgi:hypothetical protein
MWIYLAAGVAILIAINLLVVLILGSLRRRSEHDDEFE